MEFTSGLRRLVETVAIALHELIASRVTPAAEYDPRRCNSCSLIELCQPKALRLKRGAAAWFATALAGDRTAASDSTPGRG